VLEKHYHDMQDCEFTIERGNLWDCYRRARANAPALPLCDRGGYGRREVDRSRNGVQRVTPEHLDQLLHPTVDPKTDARVLARACRVLVPERGGARARCLQSCEAEEMVRGSAVGAGAPGNQSG